MDQLGSGASMDAARSGADSAAEPCSSHFLPSGYRSATKSATAPPPMPPSTPPSGRMMAS